MKRQDLLGKMKNETEIAKQYISGSLENLKKGFKKEAWDLADKAKTATICAIQSHDLFWEKYGDVISSDEFDAFSEAETCENELRNLARALKTY